MDVGGALWNVEIVNDLADGSGAVRRTGQLPFGWTVVTEPQASSSDYSPSTSNGLTDHRLPSQRENGIK
ncbi:hypothetical protein [Halocatena salina]|uniref:Uncharacterized protein n=1 Tax=Halocatena salina TaxID=2934340 RepID=A0A8U0A7G5_9EURY|nr:hypothetical protein [Halocatena salina]UPM44776.1 hypothetical protein MW046_15360 [Halocatena salina]